MFTDGIPGIQGDLTALRSKEISPFGNTLRFISEVLFNLHRLVLYLLLNQLSLRDYGQDVERLKSLLKAGEIDVTRENLLK